MVRLILIWLGALVLPMIWFCFAFVALFGGYPLLEFIVGGALFYLGYLFWAILRTRKKSSPRWLKWAMAVAFVGMFAHIAFVSAQRAYEAKFPQVNAEVDLYAYRPFRSDFLATLDAPSTLILRQNLPKLDGATALYPVYAAFVQAVYRADNGWKEVSPELANAAWREQLREPTENADYLTDYVEGSRTPVAYARLIDGDVDMIFAAAPSQKQIQAAAEKGVKFHLTPIGKEAFVFFVNAKNPVNELSVAQIQQIYAGKITDWQTVGGKKDSIRAYQRPEGSGSQSALLRIMGDVPLMIPPREDVVRGMGGIINQVATYRNHENGLGYSFRFFATQMVKDAQIKLLKINGVAPTYASIRDNSYPFSQPFYAITTGNERPEVKAFLAWIQSAQGQELIRKTGYVPLYE